MPSVRDKIVERLNSLTHLPSLPDTVLDVEQELDRKDDLSVSAVRIGKLIEKDMGISAKVLKIANSVFYAGRYGRIADVGQAVARLGIEEVRNICVTVGGLQLFAGESDLVNLRDFWRHSLGAALFIRHSGEQMPQPSPLPSGAYVAGLFHDIGILLLDRYFHDAYRIVRQKGAGKEKPLFAVEKEILGIHHGEIGAMLLDRWRLPQEICSTVRYHHEPDMCPEPSKRLCQLINIATFACSAFGIPEPGDDTFQAGKIAAEAEEGIAESGMFVAMCL